MKEQKSLLDFSTIQAAVAREVCAVEKLVEHYSDEIDRICTKMKKQADGSIKKIVDEDMLQALIRS